MVAQLAAINREAEAFRRPFPKRCASRGDLNSPGVEILGRAGPFELTADAPVVQKLTREGCHEIADRVLEGGLIATYSGPKAPISG